MGACERGESLFGHRHLFELSRGPRMLRRADSTAGAKGTKQKEAKGTTATAEWLSASEERLATTKLKNSIFLRFDMQTLEKLKQIIDGMERNKCHIEQIDMMAEFTEGPPVDGFTSKKDTGKRVLTVHYSRGPKPSK